MISYINNNVTQKTKLYEMLLNSLKYVANSTDKKNICEEMNKLENEIIDLTNEIYEDSFKQTENRSTCLLDEEKTRLLDLIELVNQRIKYLEERKNKHFEITGIQSKDYTVMGEDEIEEYTRKINIINKYQENVEEIKRLDDEIEKINEKIKLANEKNNINESLNVELENKMINLLNEAYKELKIYEIIDDKEEVEKVYKDLEYSLSLARENLSLAKDNSNELFLECKNIYDNTLNDYNKYFEYKKLIELSDIYPEKSETFDQILNKREKIENVLSKIPNSDLYKKVYDDINEQYITILIEKQDITTLNSLVEEESEKEKFKLAKEEENNSKEFQDLLQELLINEQKRQKQELLEKQKQEERERQLRIEEEKEKQEEIYKRQKMIEEKRKRETAERTKWLIEANNNTVIKNNDDFTNTLDLQPIKEEANSIEQDNINLDTIFSSSKIDISVPEKQEKNDDEFFVEEPVLRGQEEDKKSNADEFFNQDFDEYKKNFKAEDYDDDSLFVDDIVFPDISM